MVVGFSIAMDVHVAECMRCILFQCFDSALIIQGRFVFEGALYFLPIQEFLLIRMKFQTRSSNSHTAAV